MRVQTQGHKEKHARTWGGGCVVAVDTFLGSAEHYLSPETSENASIGLSARGELNLLGTFISNIEHFNLQDRVIALPLDSQSAARLVSEANIRPNLVHIDAGHSYLSVMHDLISWFEILKPGGTMVCDDYKTWRSVRQAINAFKSFTEVVNFQTSENKCSFEKPTAEFIPVGLAKTKQNDASLLGDKYILKALMSENILLRDIIKASERKYVAVQSSLSWRITKPLRKIRKYLPKMDSTS